MAFHHNFRKQVPSEGTKIHSFYLALLRGAGTKELCEIMGSALKKNPISRSVDVLTDIYDFEVEVTPRGGEKFYRIVGRIDNRGELVPVSPEPA